jgi:hypothetical protein
MESLKVDGYSDEILEKWTVYGFRYLEFDCYTD